MTPLKRLAITLLLAVIAVRQTYSLVFSSGNDKLLPGAFQCTRKVLVVLSSADRLSLKNGKSSSTGNFFNEVVVPAMSLKKAGFNAVFANPDGNPPTWMGESRLFFDSQQSFLLAEEYVKDPQKGGPTASSMHTLSSISNMDLDGFDALFIPGGNAVVEDLWHNTELGRILRHFHERSKLTAVICNGAYTLLSTKNQSPTSSVEVWPYKGYHMTVFSNAEWKLMQPVLLPDLMYGTPQDALTSHGAILNEGFPSTSHTAEDRELLSGQNPFSVNALTSKMIAKLQEKCGK